MSLGCPGLWRGVARWRRRTVVKHGVRSLVDDGGGRLNGEAGPLLHGSAIDVLLRMLHFVSPHVSRNGLREKEPWQSHVKGHPRDGLILGNLGTLDELEGERLIVEGKCEDGAGGRPGAHHEVVDGHLAGSGAARLHIQNSLGRSVVGAGPRDGDGVGGRMTAGSVYTC